jgi:hypothetical protein
MTHYDPSTPDFLAQAAEAERELATTTDPDLCRYLKVVVANRLAEVAAREASARRRLGVRGTDV